MRFDTRGTGLSTREVDAYSLDTIVSDLEAVADATAGDRFTLIGGMSEAVHGFAFPDHPHGGGYR